MGQPVTPERNPRRWLILGVLCLSLLVVVIDNMVLNIAIPSLIRDLGASTSEIQWIVDSYILVFVGLLLTAGSLSDRHGRRRGLVIGLIVFGGASALATLCQTPEQLIAARGLMGVGAEHRWRQHLLDGGRGGANAGRGGRARRGSRGGAPDASARQVLMSFRAPGAPAHQDRVAHAEC